jgi:hypothetical protein
MTFLIKPSFLKLYAIVLIVMMLGIVMPNVVASLRQDRQTYEMSIAWMLSIHIFI